MAGGRSIISTMTARTLGVRPEEMRLGDPSKAGLLGLPGGSLGASVPNISGPGGTSLLGEASVKRFAALSRLPAYRGLGLFGPPRPDFVISASHDSSLVRFDLAKWFQFILGGALNQYPVDRGFRRYDHGTDTLGIFVGNLTLNLVGLTGNHLLVPTLEFKNLSSFLLIFILRLLEVKSPLIPDQSITIEFNSEKKRVKISDNGRGMDGVDMQYLRRRLRVFAENNFFTYSCNFAGRIFKDGDRAPIALEFWIRDGRPTLWERLLEYGARESNDLPEELKRIWRNKYNTTGPFPININFFERTRGLLSQILLSHFDRYFDDPRSVVLGVAAHGLDDMLLIRLGLYLDLTVVSRESEYIHQTMRELPQYKELAAAIASGQLILSSHDLEGKPDGIDGYDIYTWAHPDPGGTLPSELVEHINPNGIMVVQTDMPGMYINPFLADSGWRLLLMRNVYERSYLMPSSQLSQGRPSGNKYATHEGSKLGIFQKKR